MTIDNRLLRGRKVRRRDNHHGDGAIARWELPMLIDDNGRFDRAAIMRKAHREFRLARMRGDMRGFGYWLSYSWRVARSRRAISLSIAA